MDKFSKTAFVIFFIILALLIGSRMVNGQSLDEGQNFKPFTYVEFQPQLALERNDGKVERGEFFGTLQAIRQWKPAVGLFIETSHGNYWGETSVGPAFQAGSWNFSGGVAVSHYEYDGIRGRFNAYYDSPGEDESFAYFEAGVGKAGNWFAVDAVHMQTQAVGLGLLLQMPGGGAGLKTELRFSKRLGLWFAPVYDWQERKTRVLLGGRVIFD